MGGWMDGLIHSFSAGWKDEWMILNVHSFTDGWIDGWMDGWMDLLTD